MKDGVDAVGIVLMIIFIGLVITLAVPPATQATTTQTVWTVDWRTITGAGQWSESSVGTSYFPSEFDYDWHNGPVYSTYYDYIGFWATATIYAHGSKTVTFTIGADDGFSFYVDGVKRLERLDGRYTTLQTTVNLDPGIHTLNLYYWEWSGDARASFSASDQTIFSQNAPTLSNSILSPTSGLIGTTFTYQIVYTDIDSDAPSYIKVYIDGTGHPMTYVSGTYTSGALYQYKTSSLAGGSHTYYFEASDGIVTTPTRVPTSDNYLGPTINSPPTLTSGSVVPTSGVVGTGFTYEVTYTDDDGDTPSYVSAFIDDIPHNMTKVSGTYTSGATYRYIWTTTSTDIGEHDYYFTASDGIYFARNPTIGIYLGPTVREKRSTSIEISSSFTVMTGDSKSLTATLKDSTGEPLANKTIHWSTNVGSFSSPSSITDSHGKASVTYYAPSYATTATITASFEGDSEYVASSSTSTGTIQFEVTITFIKPNGDPLAFRDIYYGFSEGGETTYCGTTDSQGKIVSADSALAGQTIYFKSSDGMYKGSTSVSSSGGTVNVSLSEVSGPPIWAAIVVILIICVAGGLVFAWKRGLIST